MTGYMNRDDQHLRLLPEPDRLEQLAASACKHFDRLMRSKGKRTTPAATMEIIARALLIERARSRRWRKLFELARIEAQAERTLKREAMNTYTEQCEQLVELKLALEVMTTSHRQLSDRIDEIRLGIAERTKAAEKGRASV